MSEAYILLTKTEEGRWIGCVELYGFDSRGRRFYPPANPLYMTSSDSVTKVLRRLREFRKTRKDINVTTMIRNGNPKYLGYYSKQLKEVKHEE